MIIQESRTAGGGVLVFDDFLPADMISRALKFRKGYEHLQQGFVDRKKLFIHENEPLFDELTFLISTRLIEPDVEEVTARWTDYSWRCVYSRCPGTYEVGVSRYQPGGSGYTWHTDHADGLARVLNFIIFLNDVEGGELEWCSDAMAQHQMQSDCPDELKFDAEPEGVVETRKGRLVIAPAHYPHRVRTSPSLRVVLHGHMRI